jgi:hypothetical protein
MNLFLPRLKMRRNSPTWKAITIFHVEFPPFSHLEIRIKWVTQLLRDGLTPGNFIPSKLIWKLRRLNRFLQKLAQQRSLESNPLKRSVEQVNIQFASTACNTEGVSVQQLIPHMLENDMVTKKMSDLAKGDPRRNVIGLELVAEVQCQGSSKHFMEINYQAKDDFIVLSNKRSMVALLTKKLTQERRKL